MSNGTQQGAPQKKGLPTLAWVAIGCGALTLIIIFVLVVGGMFVAKKVQDVAGEFEDNPALMAARLIVKASPELEEVSTDEDAGTMTVRNTETGEEITVNFEDIKEGRISFSSGDKEVTFEAEESEEGGSLRITGDSGTMTFSAGEATDGDIPDWVPLYAGGQPANRHTVEQPEGYGGNFQLTTKNSLQEVAAFYKDELEGAGFSVSVNSFSGGGEAMTMVAGEHEATDRNVMVNAQTRDGKTVVQVTYSKGL